MASMGRPKSYYRALNRDGDVVAEGTPQECARQLGRSSAYVYNLISGKVSYPAYWVVPAIPPNEDTDAAIKSWDEFMDPIREAYGVPRYKPNKEDNIR